MLAHHRKPVYLSLSSTDLPIWSTIETTAVLYQKDAQRFHLLLNQNTSTQQETCRKELTWLEITPTRVIMTTQGHGKLSYRHFWEQDSYGISRYWLNTQHTKNLSSLRFRNYTSSLKLDGNTLPESLRVEYELWSGKVQLGCYVMRLDISN